MAKSDGLRRKDVSGFPGEHEVVGLSTGWGLGVLTAAWNHMRGEGRGVRAGRGRTLEMKSSTKMKR